MTAGQSAIRASQEKRSPFSRWYIRLSLKWLIFLVVTFAVLFPNPAQFCRHVSHFRDLNALIDPSSPRIEAWGTEILEKIPNRPKPNLRTITQATTAQATTLPAIHLRLQKEIEASVLERVAYDWDWNVWGAADYLPTVEEIFERAAKYPDGRLREDCDGRAVIAASLMRWAGYDASIVTDFRHIWVRTSDGEWMGPGREKTIVSTASGNKWDLTTALTNLPVGLSYGIAVFPFARELIIVFTVILLMYNRRRGWVLNAAGAVLLLQGLLFMRCGVFDPTSVPGQSTSWPAWIGLAHIVAGFAVLLIPSGNKLSRISIENDQAGVSAAGAA